MDEATKAAIEALAKQLPLDKAYDDVAHGALAEAGKALTDAVKVARLLLAPVQYAAAWQDRFARFCKRIADKVPEDRRLEAPPRIAGPVLEALRFADEQDLVTELMLNLLASAMDAARVEYAHPAFAGIAVQLSSDEALILFNLKKCDYRRIWSQESRMTGPPTQSKVEAGPMAIEEESFPRASLAQAEHFDVYMSHLQTLGLALYTKGSGPSAVSHRVLSDPPGVISFGRNRDDARLTAFGRLFANACVPDDLPES